MAKKYDLPAMPFYIGDWKKDPAVQTLTREQKMIWLDMIFLMWESAERGYLTVNGKPLTNIMLASALNLDNHNLTTCLTLFEELGLFSRRENDGAIFSRKIINLVELSEKRKNAGLLGGNPNLLNQKKSKSKTKGYSSTEIENINENINENEIEVKKENLIETLLKIFKEKYLKNKKVIYVESKLDTKHLGMLLGKMKTQFSEYDTNEMVKLFEVLFDKCTAINNDNFLNQITIPFLNSQLNKYINYIKNGKQSSMSKGYGFQGTDIEKYKRLFEKI